MDKLTLKNNITKLVFGLTLFFSFILIIYTFQNDALVNHDLHMGYGRTFFEPEHGRYIATFVNSLFTEEIPYLLNMHPNIIVKYLVCPIKAILIILFCLVFANSFFIFQKEEKNILKFELNNIAFLFTYITSFFIMFNFNYFFNSGEIAFFGSQESTLFWEYPCSLFFFVILFNLLSFYITKPEYLVNPISKKNYITILIVSFLTGISVEPINGPVLIVLTVLFLLFLLNIKKFNKDLIKKIFILYGVYIISIICYYISPCDESIFYHPYKTYINYLTNAFPQFLNSYLHNFCLNMLFFMIPIVIMSIVMFFKNKNQSRNIIYFILLNLFSIFMVYFMTFFIGFQDEAGKFFYCEFPKWGFLYKTMSLYLVILLIGYFIDICTVTNKKKLIKIILCILFLIVFSKDLFFKYSNNIMHWREYHKDIKTKCYIIEKIALSQENNDSETIILPKRFKLSDNEEIELEEVSLYATNDPSQNACFICYLKSLYYPYFANKKYIILTDDFVLDDNLFEKDELKILNFQKLITHRIQKPKKENLLYKRDKLYWHFRNLFNLKKYLKE